MREVIVTGASGFIGSYVADSLVAAGCNVIAPVRRIQDTHSESRLQYVQCDLSERSAIDLIAQKVQDCDALIHIAADIHIPGTTDSFASNIAMTANMVSLVARLGIKKLIYISSIPVIGKPLYTPIDENHQINPVTLYHHSKYIGEKIVLNGLPNCTCQVLRIASPVGVGMSESVFLSRVIRSAKAGEEIKVWGNGTRVQNYIDVRDVAEAVIRSLESGLESDGVFLIKGHESISNIGLIERCISLLNSSSRLVMTGIEDPSEDERWVIDGSKAEQLLGYRPKYLLDDSIGWISDDME